MARFNTISKKVEAAGGVAAFARIMGRLKIPRSYFVQIVRGYRSAGQKLAVRFERASGNCGLDRGDLNDTCHTCPFYRAVKKTNLATTTREG